MVNIDQLKIEATMPSKEFIALMLEEGYHYDAYNDIYFPQLNLQVDPSSYKTFNPRDYSSDDECDIAWDDSWDFGSSMLSHPESELEMIVWSACSTDGDLYDDGVSFMDQYGESNLYTLEYENNVELDELNLISEHTLQILSQPLSYYVICEERYPPPIQCPREKPICLPTKAFESFDSVESIMQLLEAMPSLKRGKCNNFKFQIQFNSQRAH